MQLLLSNSTFRGQFLSQKVEGYFRKKKNAQPNTSTKSEKNIQILKFKTRCHLESRFSIVFHTISIVPKCNLTTFYFFIQIFLGDFIHIFEIYYDGDFASLLEC